MSYFNDVTHKKNTPMSVAIDDFLINSPTIGLLIGLFFVKKFYPLFLFSLTVFTISSFLLLILVLGVYISPTGGISYCNLNDLITKN